MMAAWSNCLGTVQTILDSLESESEKELQNCTLEVRFSNLIPCEYQFTNLLEGKPYHYEISHFFEWGAYQQLVSSHYL